MLKKIIAATLALAILAALIPVSLADSGDVNPYNGWIGADSPLYSIKIFAQNLDVSLTLNDTAKMNKELAYADERLAEAKAMMLANNSAGLQAAIDNYENEMNAINQTTQAPDINDSDYANISAALDNHLQAIYDMLNNSTIPQCRQSIQDACNATIRLKKGMPFIYYNNTTYFIPPGQFKNNNSTFVPPGMAKKGYIRPTPTVINGSPTWPWDQINFPNDTRNYTMPTIMPMPTMPPTKFNGHGNGNGSGNGHGNGNSHGSGYVGPSVH